MGLRNDTVKCAFDLSRDVAEGIETYVRGQPAGAPKMKKREVVELALRRFLMAEAARVAAAVNEGA